MDKIRLLLALGALTVIAGCATQPTSRPGPAGHAPPKPAQQMPAPGRTGPGESAPPTRQPNAGGNQANGALRQPSQNVPPRSASQVSSPAVMSLLSRADTLAKAGHMDAAAATLERALNLDPRNPFIYQRLAAVRLAQSQPGQAEQMAMKSNSVSNDNPFVKASNWKLIAEARRQSGNDRGAQRASAQAVNFRQATSQYGQ